MASADDQVIPRSRARIHVHDDSRRWDRFELRPDDIVITTPPKSGTTWTQGIVTSLLWPDGDAPAPAFDLSPWLDLRVMPIDDVLERLDTMPHRRFIKTHSPADCTPVDRSCRYLAVYRDPRDAIVSWANHRSKERPELIEAMNADAARDAIAPWPPTWDGDMATLYDEWTDWGTPMEHLASWWPHRGQPYVLFVHYADLSADLDGEMRRIADFLAIDVPEARWPEVVGRCTLDAMRADHQQRSMMLELGFEGGATTFFNRGTGGGWKDRLDDSLLEQLDALAREELPDDAARAWLRDGSLVSGWRP